MKTLFMALFALVLITTGWMHLLQKEFIRSDGSSFSIMTLELPDSSASVQDIISTAPASTHAAVLEQLNVDYVFMVGCYLGILMLCLIAIRSIGTINTLKTEMHKPVSGMFWKQVLLALAVLQLLAWGLDVWENAQIEQWFKTRIADDDLSFFKTRVYIKFAIGLAGFLTAAGLLAITYSLADKLQDEKRKMMPPVKQ